MQKIFHVMSFWNNYILGKWRQRGIFSNISFLRRGTHSALLGKGIRTPSGIPSHSLSHVKEKIQRDVVPSNKNVNQTNLHRWANRNIALTNFVGYHWHNMDTCATEISHRLNSWDIIPSVIAIPWGFSSFRFSSSMEFISANLLTHWSSIGFLDCLTLLYIAVNAFFIFGTNRLFVGKFRFPLMSCLNILSIEYFKASSMQSLRAERRL